MKAEEQKTYVSVYSSMFPANGAVSGRNNFFIYLTETLPVGTKVHFALTFTAMDETATWLQLRDTAASVADISIAMPAQSVDVEYETQQRATNILWCYFNDSVTGVQIDLTTIKVEKIV